MILVKSNFVAKKPGLGCFLKRGSVTSLDLVCLVLYAELYPFYELGSVKLAPPFAIERK